MNPKLDAPVQPIRTVGDRVVSVIDFSCLNLTNDSPTSVPACHNHKYATVLYSCCPSGLSGRRMPIIQYDTRK